MIRHIIFDLDGVLIDAKEIHSTIFRAAYNLIVGAERGRLSKEWHDEFLCGLPTEVKLQRLGVTCPAQFKEITDLKQQMTAERLNSLSVDTELVELLNRLKSENLILSCASNSIENTVAIVLHRLGIKECFTCIVNSSRVLRAKPSPEMYYKCMLGADIWVPETLIVEDSPVGAEAILKSGCKGLMVKNRADVTYERIKNAMS